jgi:hypothetical protein
VQNEELDRLLELKEHLDGRVDFLIKQIEKKDKLIEMLKSQRGVTAAEFCSATGSTKCTSRISDLKKNGLTIVDKWEHSIHYGTAPYKRYWLKEDGREV